jgi:hypothetical protein
MLRLLPPIREEEGPCPEDVTPFLRPFGGGDHRRGLFVPTPHQLNDQRGLRVTRRAESISSTMRTDGKTEQLLAQSPLGWSALFGDRCDTSRSPSTWYPPRRLGDCGAGATVRGTVTNAPSVQASPESERLVARSVSSLAFLIAHASRRSVSSFAGLCFSRFSTTWCSIIHLKSHSAKSTLS